MHVDMVFDVIQLRVLLLAVFTDEELVLATSEIIRYMSLVVASAQAFVVLTWLFLYLDV